MSQKNLIIITGSSGSGKTTILDKIKKDYIHFSVNSIKEDLFNKYYQIKKERLDLKTKEIYNSSSLNLFWKLLDKFMSKSINIVVEYFFTHDQTVNFNSLITKHGYRCILIIVYVPKYQLLERKIKRVESDKRHKGHYNHIGNKKKFLTILKKKLEKTKKIDSEKDKEKYIERYNLDLINSKTIIFDNSYKK